MTVGFTVRLALAAAAFTACASSAPPPKPARVRAERPRTPEALVAALEDRQTTEVVAFDGASELAERCDALCYHLQQICGLGEAICQIATAHPSPVTTDACARARATCEGTRDRLPPECLCGQG